jgi:DNA-directed RNA polymerase subunit delta
VGKKRIIKAYEQLPDDLVERIKEKYPDGFDDHLITFTNPRGEIEVALPFETDDTYYLVKMPKSAASDDEEDFESSSYDEFDNFENLEIGEDVADEEE